MVQGEERRHGLAMITMRSRFISQALDALERHEGCVEAEEPRTCIR